MNSLVLRDILRSAFVTPLVCMQRDYWRWMAAHSGSVVNVVAATARGGSQDAALAAWLSAELAPRVNVHPLVPGASLDTGAYQTGAAERVRTPDPPDGLQARTGARAQCED